MKSQPAGLFDHPQKTVTKIFPQQDSGQKLPIVQGSFIDVIAGEMGCTLLF